MLDFILQWVLVLLGACFGYRYGYDKCDSDYQELFETAHPDTLIKMINYYRGY